MLKLPRRNKFSTNKIITLKNRLYNNTQPTFKPNGFWYYNFNDGYNLHKGFPANYLHQINLNENCETDIFNKNIKKLLILSNTKDFDVFTSTYGIVNKNYNKYGNFGNIKCPHFYSDLIDWDKVSKDFGGFEIPLNVTTKNKYLWYQNFHFSGGCIWNIESIINSTLLIHENK